MRNTLIAIGLIAAAALPLGSARAQSTPRATEFQIAQVYQDRGYETPPRRSRPRVRIYRDIDERGVYPSYNPGPNAVRDCTARYVQEYRPSGTVITPRVNCFWRPG